MTNRRVLVCRFAFLVCFALARLSVAAEPTAAFANEIDRKAPVARLIRPARDGGNQAELIALTFAEATARYPNRNPSDLWRAMTQGAYMHLHQKHLKRGLRSARQSWASASGRAFEEHVARSINARLADKGILAVRPKRLPKSRRAIRDSIKLKIVRPCNPEPLFVEPDNDIILVSNTTDGPKAFGIVSCKTSLHARLTESMYWAILIKQQLAVKVIFVTLDLDQEFGTCRNPTRQDRVMGEAFFDMMYSLNEATVKCPKMKPFSECSDDIVRWRDHMLKNTVRERFQIE